jgi:phosphatidylglycerol lysyltransferase
MTVIGGFASYASPEPGPALARTLLRAYGWNTISCQILTPGIAHWFAADGTAVVGYVPVGRTWVVAGGPVCAAERLGATVAAFTTTAAQQRRRVCYFGAQEQLAAVAAAQGLPARLLLGAQPVWDPHGWPAILAHKASLRAQLARARHKGVTISPMPADLAAQSPELRHCLSEWLSTRGLPPMRFVVAPAALSARNDHQVLVARREATVVAYLVATPIPQRNGWLIEQIVRGRSAPNGTAELLIDAAMHMLASAGATYVTLGLAPLSPHAPAGHPAPPALIQALLAWARSHGQRFYNFSGLDAFKAKLQPDSWEPVYALSSERQPSLRMLYAIAGAFGGGSPALFLSRALLRAGLLELRWLGKQLRG